MYYWWAMHKKTDRVVAVSDEGKQIAWECYFE